MSEPATAGKWTTEPPNVPGLYPYRWYDYEKGEMRHANYYRGDTVVFAADGEWWTIPIQEPPR